MLVAVPVGVPGDPTTTALFSSVLPSPHAPDEIIFNWLSVVNPVPPEQLTTPLLSGLEKIFRLAGKNS